MIAFVSSSSDEFPTLRLARLLPPHAAAIRTQARFGFRHLRPEERAEAVQEVIANAFVAYRRLVELVTRTWLTHALASTPSPRSAKAPVGNRLNVHDITSRYCQRRRGIRVDRLDRYDDRRGRGGTRGRRSERHAGRNRYPAD